MKTCSKCSETKSLENFSKNSKTKDGRHSWCKLCFAQYERDRYQNGDRVRKEKNRATIIKKRQNFIWNILTASKCKVCGLDDPLVLEFDHRDPETKVYNITDMYNLAESTIQKEIDKCDILCANCHRRRTIHQFGFWRGNAALAEMD